LPVEVLEELWFSLSEENDGPGVGVGDAAVPAPVPFGVRSRCKESVVLAPVLRRAMVKGLVVGRLREAAGDKPACDATAYGGMLYAI
jgi:hypothetical protein